MWVLRLQQLRITVIKQNSVALVIRHWRNVHNYSRRERKMTWIRKEIKNEPQHLGCAGCKSSGEPPSLPHSAPPPPAAAPGASPAALTSPAETRSADEINITVAPTSPTYWDPLLDVMKEKKRRKTRRWLQNHQASRIMCILLLFFLPPAHLLESACSSQTIQFILLLMWLFQWRKWQRNKNRSWDGD